MQDNPSMRHTQKEPTVSTLILAVTLALAFAGMWITEAYECWIEPGTDTCVRCADDCLAPADEEDL